MPETWIKVGNAFIPSGNKTGTAYANSTALTDVSPGAGTAGLAFSIGQDYPVLKIGSLVRVTAAGIFSTEGAPKLKLGLYWGGVAGVALAETVEVTCPTTTNAVWTLNATIRILETGTSGKASTLGTVTGIEAVSAAAASAGVTMLPGTSASGGESTVNTQEAKVLTLGAKWGTAVAANTLTVYQWIVETLTAPT